jgi:hypothetical protein
VILPATVGRHEAIGAADCFTHSGDLWENQQPIGYLTDPLSDRAVQYIRSHRETARLVTSTTAARIVARLARVSQSDGLQS